MSDLYAMGNTDYARQLAQMLMPQGQPMQGPPTNMGQPGMAGQPQQWNPMQAIQEERTQQLQRIPRLLNTQANYAPEGM